MPTRALWQSGNVLAGYLNLVMPEMAGATFRQSVDMHQAEVTTTLTKEQEVTLVRSLVPHESDNILVNSIEHRGTKPLVLRIETCADQFAIRAEPFEVAAGLDTENPTITWASRKTHVPPDHNDFGSRQFRMWAVSATRLFDVQCKTEVDTAIDYDKNDMQVQSAQLLTLEPGRSLLIVTKVHSTGIPITMDPPGPQAGGDWPL